MSFNTSTRKEDVSLKLRAVNLHKARDETKQLEEESRKMEERLRELKMAMTREKEERERAQSGFWNKGKQGALTSYAQEVLSKPQLKAQKPKKVKVLKDEPITPPVRVKVPGTIGFIAQRGNSDKENKIRGPKCGQCEHKAAQVVCLECGEEYCASCFAAFHLRGNLKKHRSVPVGAKVSRTPRANITPRKQNFESDKTKPLSNEKRVMFSEYSPEHLSPAPPVQNGTDRSLLDGEYNEAESAAAFQQALDDWRGGDSAATKQQVNHHPVSPVRSPVVSIEHGTSTDSTLETKMPDITFHSSLSYAEKLMLKRHRRTELQPLPDDLRSESETRRRSSEFGSPDQPMSSRIEVNGQDTPEETLVQVLSEPKEEENEGIHWQDIHRAMQSDSMIRCDSRSDSRLSIIELEEEQPVKSRRRGRGVDVTQTSTYNVSEVGYEEDMEILSARKQSARRKPHSGHKLSSARKQNNASHPPSADISRQSSSRRLASTAQPIKVQKETEQLVTRIQLSGDSSKKRTSTRPKSRSQLPSSRPKSSRADHSRPSSRAMSRTETRLALFGEGELTKTPSEALKEVSRMTPRPDPVSFLPTMGEFFTFGSEVTGDEATSRALTPNDTKRLKGDGKEVGIPKWKVSYNLYSMGPRSWKPEKSLKDQVADGEVAEMVEEVSEKLQMFLAPDDVGDVSQETEIYLAHNNSTDNETTQTASRDSPRNNYASRQLSSDARNNHVMSEPSKTPREIRLNSRNNIQQISETSKPTTPNGIRPRSYRTERPLSNTSKPFTPREKGKTRPRSANHRDDAELTPRPESRAIVVDGDDLTSYDFEENVREQDAEDEKSWYQLEWELASHDGRITEDGKVSRLSLLSSPEADELTELQPQQEETSFKILQQDTAHLSPGTSLDLRMNNLMEDFEEMEQKMNDEEDVKALAS